VDVLAALGVPASTERQRNSALSAHNRSYWAAVAGFHRRRAGAPTRFWFM